jgi:hypothetical protein
VRIAYFFSLLRLTQTQRLPSTLPSPRPQLVQALAVMGVVRDGGGSPSDDSGSGALNGQSYTGDTSVAQKIRLQLLHVRQQKRGFDGEALVDACSNVCPNPLLSNPCPTEVCHMCTVCTVS